MSPTYTTVKNSAADYPPLLCEIQSPPKILYIHGTLEPDEDYFAIVGTRKPTAYGREIARLFSEALSRAGFTIVSGLALGIDAVAHKACLEASGRTIGVLGCGIDRIYPEENRRLGEEVAMHGALISELSPGTPSLPFHFPQRNRIISGLSKGVLVIEAGEKSGALITASYAAEQNREVFAIPGPVTSPMSAGTNALIQQGAKLVRTPEDVLIEFSRLPLARPIRTTTTASGIDNESETLLTLLRERGPMDTHSMASELGHTFAPEHLQATLTMLELSRLIKRVGDGTYRVL
ncbi:MAG: DNA-protecting protein DprA [Parcubacteria group bacterium]|nr:DNA-protecting protein DprA [Parcubacteria group bacterium]